MLVPDINAVHNIVPPLMIAGKSNFSLPPEKQIYIETSGVSYPDRVASEQEKQSIVATKEFAQRIKECHEVDLALARRKFRKLHNYEIPGADGRPRPIVEFDDFLRHGDPMLVLWYLDVIQSTEKLSAAERRNFLPPAASPSGSREKAAKATGSAKTATKRKSKPATATT